MRTLRDVVYGLAVGDALGVPYEFKARDTFNCKNMVGFGTHNQPAGTWSDDTSMLLTTCDSLRFREEVNVLDIAERLLAWYRHGEYSPDGKVFDIGNGTADAIERYARCGNPHTSGNDDLYSNGNGCLMRVLPLAFFDGITAMNVEKVCAVTHANAISKRATFVLILIIITIANGFTITDSNLSGWVQQLNAEYAATGVLNPFNQLLELSTKERHEIASTGYVVDTLQAALWCFMTTNNYKDCVLTAVNLGNDADSVAALAGAFAGLKYGAEGIPQSWLSKLRRKDIIEGCLF